MEHDGIVLAAGNDMNDDLERVLESLLHDLRGPLGVAGGYLRLLRHQRLPSELDAERAIVKTQDALRTMTTLCADASEWLAPPTPKPEAFTQVESFVTRVSDELRSLRLACVCNNDEPEAMIALTLDTGRVARAIAALLAAAATVPGASCEAETTPDRLRFVVRAPARPAVETPRGFDPWAYPGLGAALGCRTIVQAGGRCDGALENGIVVRVEFDLRRAPGAPVTGGADLSSPAPSSDA